MIATIKKAFLAAPMLFLGIADANANPDVWVKAGLTYQFENGELTGFKFRWEFDDYFSSRSIQTYDANQNGILEPAESDRLRTEAFDPLLKFGYYIHLWVAEEKREPLTVQDFTATIDGPHLVYEFSASVTPPADPSTTVIIASLYDEKTVVDFRFFEENFLLAEGEMDSNCKFRLSRGKVEQAGHPQVVTLTCGA